jgi:hypothetical protein
VVRNARFQHGAGAGQRPGIPVHDLCGSHPRDPKSPHGDNRIAASRGARAAERIILGVCLLNLLFLTGIALWFRPMHPSELHGLSLMVEIVLGLGVLAALLTVGALFYTVLAWKNGYWGVANRAYYSLVTVAAIAFVWFLHYWNWLGWRY